MRACTFAFRTIVCCLLYATFGCAHGPELQPRAPASPVTATRVGRKGGADVIVELPFRIRTAFEMAVLDLGAAAGVPIGLELVADRSSEVYPPSGALIRPNVIVLTGMTVQRALDTLTRIDPRYEWFETDGVINVRPKGARRDPDDYLNMTLSPAIGDLSTTTLDGIQHAYRVQYAPLAGRSVPWYNPPPRPATPSPDLAPQFLADFERQRAFWNRPISIPKKGRLFVDLLNQAIGAHGEACWRVEYKQPPARYSNAWITFNSFAGFGGGSGPYPPAGASGQPAGAEEPQPLAARRAEEVRPRAPALSRVVPNARINYPVAPEDAFAAAQHLGALTKAPLVVEWPRGKMRLPFERPGEGLQLGGMKLEEALNRLAREQPLFKWVKGRFGIEVLPGDAEADAGNFLNARMPVFELIDGTYFDVFPILDRFFNVPAGAYPRVPLPNQNTRTPEQADAMRGFYMRPITVVLENATVRDILSAVATAHGELVWAVTWTGDSRDYGSCFLSVNGWSNAEAFSYRPAPRRH